MDHLRGLGLTPDQVFALVRASAILLGALAAQVVVRRVVRRLRMHILAVMRRRPRVNESELAKRAGTLEGIARKALNTALWFAVGLSIPRQFGFDLTPVLAGLGVAGIALGLGARTLVRDVLSGVFLLLENQIREGDVCEIDGRRGAVVEMNLRTTMLRSGDGTVHVFPNGAITSLANVTRGYSCFVLDLPVSLREDPDRVMAALRETAAALREAPDFQPLILEPLEMLGVDRFTSSAMMIRARLKTAPGGQMRVGRELNRRIKRRFDELGIRFPHPGRTLYFGEAAGPVQLDGGVRGVQRR